MCNRRLTALRNSIIVLLLSTAAAMAAEIDWYSIDGGGGISTSGNIQLIGVIGQSDTILMKGGKLSLSGGYLALPPASETLFKDSFE